MLMGCLAVAQLVLIGAVTLYEYYKRSIGVFLWGMSFVIFGAVHLLVVVRGTLKYPAWVYNNASLFVIGFSAIYLATRILILRSDYALSVDTTNHLMKAYSNIAINRRFIRITMVILIVATGYSTYTIIRVSGGILSSSWGTAYNYYSTQGYITFDKAIRWFLLPCGSLFFVGLVAKDRHIQIMTAFPLLLFVIVSRNKADCLPLLTGIIAYYAFGKGRMRTKNLLVLVLLGALGVCTVYALQTFRHLGTIDDIVNSVSLAEFINLILDKIFSGEGELSLIQVFYHFIYHDNNFSNFNKGYTYIRMLLVLLPTRFSFGIKPADFAISMGSALIMDPNNTSFSTHPTFYGDLFANFGYYGVFLGILWALLIFCLDKLADRENQIVKLVLINLIASNYILIGRGSVYNSFASIVYGSIIIGIIHFLARLKLNVR